MRLKLLAFLLALSLPFFAQTDSLQKLLAAATHDTTRCRLLNALIENENNDAVWPKYNEQLQQITEKNLKNPGTLKNFYLKYKATAINNLGYLASMHGNNDQAITYYENSLALQRSINNKMGIAAVLYNLGDIYALQGNLHKSLEYLLESLKLHEALGDKTGTAYVLNDLGWQYHVQGDDENALRYLGKALALREKLNDMRGLANTYNNLGIICMGKRDFEKAEAYMLKGLSLMKESGDVRGEALCLNNLGSIYHRKQQFDKALEYYGQSATLHKQLDDKGGLLLAKNNMANIMMEQAHGDRKKLTEVLKLANECMTSAKEMGLPGDISVAASTLHLIYFNLGDFKKAYENFALHIRMRDSVSNRETRKAAVKKQLQYEYAKKAAADSVRNREAQKVKDAQLNAQQAQLKQERTFRYALYSGLALVIVFLFFLFNRFRVTQRQKGIIEEQKKRVDQAYASLHEKNKEILDSIHYAQRIQRALITSDKYVQKQLDRLRPKN